MGNCLRLGISRIGLAWTRRRMKTTIKRNSISILILGTQAVGKTTIALRLWKYKRTLPDLNYVQTKGFNTYTIRRKNKSTINLYDLGGHPSIQELWDHYYADAHGVIFVVDVSDQNSLVDSGLVFSKVLNDERIRGKPILLLANKQDLGGASEVELDILMNLQEIVNAARCLTRLDESSATDLKNDKGIFEGFRWLVSHIQNHYHELNDRVMHDILEEKNREKTRRAAVKEQMELDSANNVESVNTVPSRTFIRDESSIDLQNQDGGDNGDKILFSKPKLETGPRNYLIKSRPNSSVGESTSPFLVHRDVFEARSSTRRSLPSIQPLSNRNLKIPKKQDFLRTGLNSGANNATIIDQSNSDLDQLLENGSVETVAAMTRIGNGSAGRGDRLSPEGADSDEGIINPAFDTEKNSKELSTFPKLTAQNIQMMPSVDDLSPKINSAQRPFSSPEKFSRLTRTESSDTERAGEILMVTTLVQVHQDSKERRSSTTSTHDSVALSSLCSFKSEEINVIEEDVSQSPAPTSPSIPTSPQHQISTPSKLATGNVFRVTESGRATVPSFEKARQRHNFRKNKTAPMPPGMVINSIQSPSPLDSKVITGNNKISMPKQNVSVRGGGKSSRLKKRNLSGFSETSTAPFLRDVSRSQQEIAGKVIIK